LPPIIIIIITISYNNNNDLFIHLRLGDVQSNTLKVTKYYDNLLSKLDFENGYISSDSIQNETCKYFIKKYAPKNIMTYCDRNTSTGNVYLKNGLHIFCATSSDDELSICLRKKLRAESFLESPYTRRVVLSNKNIYIHNDGNSINFLHGAVVDKFIELVQGEIIYSLGSLCGAPRGRISYLPDLDKKYIAHQWISQYGHGRALLC
jgi:hypothetical protein